MLPEFYGNPQSIQQVIINLVDNAYDALRYKENIEEDKIISIDCLGKEKERSEQICIHVTDNGIGMPKDVVSKAKDAFFTTKPSVEGSGLGLSIVNEIIGRHNGSFSIESSGDQYAAKRAVIKITCIVAGKRNALVNEV